MLTGFIILLGIVASIIVYKLIDKRFGKWVADYEEERRMDKLERIHNVRVYTKRRNRIKRVA